MGVALGSAPAYQNLKRHTPAYRRLFLRSESFFNLATEIEHLDTESPSFPPLINSYGGVSLHEQSHGESFWSLFIHRFGGNGLYILDEPEAALSPARQMAMLLRMHELVQANSQFIIATHSAILPAYPNALIYEFDNDGIHLRQYEQTQLFQTYNDFFRNPAYVVYHILNR